MKVNKPLMAASLAASLGLPVYAQSLFIDFEGVTGTGALKDSVSIDSYYNGGFSTVLPTFPLTGGTMIPGPVPGSGVSFQEALGITNVVNSGIGNFFQAGLETTLGLGGTAMSFPNANPQGTAVLTAEFDGGFSFYFSSNSNLRVRAFDGTTALALTVATSAPMNKDETRPDLAVFDAQAFANGCDVSGGGVTNIRSFCNWSKVDVTFATGVKATSIAFFNTSGSGLPEGDAGGYGTLIDGIALNHLRMPVPEPSTYLLMALGLLGIGIARRRQMR